MTNKQCQGMVDISYKESTLRKAIAEALVKFPRKSFLDLVGHKSPKGDVLEVARIAGLMAAKNTPNLLPMCHPLLLEKVKVDFKLLPTKNAVHITAQVLCTGKTGVEMEALAAVSAAALCIYDMMKWSSHEIEITGIKLNHKSGGKSGVFER